MRSIMKIATLVALSLAACSSTNPGARAASPSVARPAPLAPEPASRTAVVIVWVCAGDGEAFGASGACASYCYAHFTGPDAQCYRDGL